MLGTGAILAVSVRHRMSAQLGLSVLLELTHQKFVQPVSHVLLTVHTEDKVESQTLNNLYSFST